MKARKLSINKKVIRNLTDEEVSMVAGGYTSNPYATIVGNTCACDTQGCVTQGCTDTCHSWCDFC